MLSDTIYGPVRTASNAAKSSSSIVPHALTSKLVQAAIASAAGPVKQRSNTLKSARSTSRSPSESPSAQFSAQVDPSPW